MLTRDLMLGIAIGFVTCYAIHHYAIPLPGPNSAAKKKGMQS